MCKRCVSFRWSRVQIKTIPKADTQLCEQALSILATHGKPVYEGADKGFKTTVHEVYLPDNDNKFPGSLRYADEQEMKKNHEKFESGRKLVIHALEQEGKPAEITIDLLSVKNGEEKRISRRNPTSDQAGPKEETPDRAESAFRQYARSVRSQTFNSAADSKGF